MEVVVFSRTKVHPFCQDQRNHVGQVITLTCDEMRELSWISMPPSAHETNFNEYPCPITVLATQCYTWKTYLELVEWHLFLRLSYLPARRDQRLASFPLASGSGRFHKITTATLSSRHNTYNTSPSFLFHSL